MTQKDSFIVEATADAAAPTVTAPDDTIAYNVCRRTGAKGPGVVEATIQGRAGADKVKAELEKTLKDGQSIILRPVVMPVIQTADEWIAATEAARNEEAERAKLIATLSPEALKLLKINA